MRLTVVALLTALALACVPPAEAASKRKVGSVTLHRCDFMSGWCGSAPRPLDPKRPHGPRIDIGFLWLPARGGHAHGPTLVAVEGGPGYPAIGSRSGYQAIYGPLLRRRNLLLVDNRGSSRSGLIGCEGVQSVAGAGATPGFAARVGNCARKLNRHYAHASDLYATAYAVNDLSAIVRKLRLGRVDLYGDSYGTWFAQSFMARHPDQLHSVILDSAYPVHGLDVWRAASGEAARYAMDAVCSRDTACSGSAPGSATARLAQLLALVRQTPIEGDTREANNSKVHVTIGVGALVDLVQDAGADPIVYRELDASVRAALAGDPAPLLRLTAQSRSWNRAPLPPFYFSAGLYFAVSCIDYPQLFDLGASPAERRRQFAARIGTAPDAFSPFAPAEWLRMSAWSEDYYGCLDWPRPTHHAPPLPRKLRPLPASVPVLVLGGDLDSLTPLSSAQNLAPTLGRKVRVVTLRNTTHVTSEGYNHLFAGAACARQIIRGFVRAPRRVSQLDARCAEAIPPIHTPGSYPLTLADAPAAQLVSGPDPGERARRAATVAVGSLADAGMRSFYGRAHRGPGLRGGAFTFAPARSRVADFQFDAVRFVSDAAVDGAGTWEMSGSGRFRGDLTVRQANAPPVHVNVHWNQNDSTAHATVEGATLTLPAP